MLILIHGENAFLSREKLNVHISSFKRKFGENSVVALSGADITVDNIVCEATSISMFSSEKLVVAKNFSESKGLRDLPDVFSKKDLSSVNIIFWENKPADKRTTFYKFLKKEGKVEEYDELKGAALTKWVSSEFANRNKKIRSKEINLLLSRVGEEMWKLSGEIEKLSIYSNKNLISADDIVKVVSVSAAVEIWGFIDAMGARDKKRALNLFEHLLAQGEDPSYLISMITWQFRRFILVEYLKGKGARSDEIARRMKLHPFSSKKLFAQSGKIDFNRLKAIYNKLVDIDMGIKTSNLEPKFAISLLLSSI